MPVKTYMYHLTPNNAAQFSVVGLWKWGVALRIKKAPANHMVPYFMITEPVRETNLIMGGPQVIAWLEDKYVEVPMT